MVVKLFIGTSTNNNSGIGTVVATIAGLVGGAALFIVISLFCVILCARQYHNKKRSHTFDNNMEAEVSSDIKLNANPSYGYGITKQMQNRKQDQYDYVLHKIPSCQDNTQNIVKMDSNPSYGHGNVQSLNTVAHDTTKPAEYDVTIQPNPSHSSILKENVMMYEQEDQDGYVETNSLSTQRADYLKVIGSTTKEKESQWLYDEATDDTDKVNINPNPSYNIVSSGVKLEDNPSYNKILSQHA